MVGLDRAAFQNIRVNGSLGQELNALQFPGFLLKHTNKLRANDLPLGLRVCYTGQLVQETVHCIHINQIGVHLIPEYFHHLLGFSLPQKAMVDMDASELLSHRLNQQGRHHRRIHAARQCQQDLFISHLCPDSRHLLGNELFRQGRGW